MQHHFQLWTELLHSAKEKKQIAGKSKETENKVVFFFVLFFQSAHNQSDINLFIPLQELYLSRNPMHRFLLWLILLCLAYNYMASLVFRRENAKIKISLNKKN